MPIVVVGNVFVDIKGFPEGNYIPAGRNAGKIEIVHGGVGRNVAEDIANLELRPRFVSMVDESAEGREVVRKLKNHKTDVDYVVAVPDGMGMWLAVFDSSGDIAGSISKRPNMLPLVQLLEEKGLTIQETPTGGAVQILSIHKSKGLEYPVVFLSSLSRSFNKEDLRAQVLCEKELGLGLSAVDRENRVRYPTIAKRAIVARTARESLSEELRVLYVGMTRARDRLIMTYAEKKPEATLADIAQRIKASGKSIYFEVSPLQWGLWTTGRGTFMHELAEMCGLTNAFGDLDGWGAVSEEQVLEVWRQLGHRQQPVLINVPSPNIKNAPLKDGSGQKRIFQNFQKKKILSRRGRRFGLFKGGIIEF